MTKHFISLKISKTMQSQHQIMMAIKGIKVQMLKIKIAIGQECDSVCLGFIQSVPFFIIGVEYRK